MKVINLDRFKTKQNIILDGTTYEVRGVTVEQFLMESDRNPTESTVQEQYLHYIDKIAEISDIPPEVLKKQEPAVLIALIKISQGVDPEAELDGETDSPEKK